MMDDKMKAALNEWFQKEKTVHIYEIAEFVLDYLRSQQEPVGFWGQMPDTTSPDAIRVGWEPNYRPKVGDRPARPDNEGDPLDAAARRAFAHREEGELR